MNIQSKLRMAVLSTLTMVLLAGCEEDGETSSATEMAAEVAAGDETVTPVSEEDPYASLGPYLGNWASSANLTYQGTNYSTTAQQNLLIHIYQDAPEIQMGVVIASDPAGSNYSISTLGRAAWDAAGRTLAWEINVLVLGSPTLSKLHPGTITFSDPTNGVLSIPTWLGGFRMSIQKE